MSRSQNETRWRIARAILPEELNDFYEIRVEVKRIRNGKYQTLKTLI